MKVQYIDHMGSDLSVVNAARVSFGKRSEYTDVTDFLNGLTPHPVLHEADKKLIQYLARGCTKQDWDCMMEDIFDLAGCDLYDSLEETVKHIRNMPQHWSPFGHTAITLHIKAPLFVARQLGKHQVGFVWNEVSRRYITDEPEFYHPQWRQATEHVKQGSGDVVDDQSQKRYDAILRQSEQHALHNYTYLLTEGICAEQARMILPQSMYTEWYWTGNLYGFSNVFIQRTDAHAQREVQEVAHQIGDILAELFPVSWEALTC